MRIAYICIIVIALSVCGLSERAEARVDIGVTIGDEGIRDFYFSVGDYYRVPEREVIIIRERRIPDEEIPVVLFLAKRGGVPFARVIEMRRSGLAWIDITLRLGLSPEIFYVPVTIVSGPPYGKAYGHFKKKHKNEWRTIRLSDDDVINFVNLKFISDYHGYAPERVIEMRSKGKNFIAINDEVKKVKGNKEKHKKEEKEDKEEWKKEKHKDKGKGKGHKKFED